MIENSKRIVFKFGTNILRNEHGEISLAHLYSFIEDLSYLYKEGKEITVLLDKKHRRVYDKYSLITCFVGFVFTVMTVAGAVYFVVSNGVTFG